jgi:hypothetical protein
LGFELVIMPGLVNPFAALRRDFATGAFGLHAKLQTQRSAVDESRILPSSAGAYRFAPFTIVK